MVLYRAWLAVVGREEEEEVVVVAEVAEVCQAWELVLDCRAD